MATARPRKSALTICSVLLAGVALTMLLMLNASVTYATDEGQAFAAERGVQRQGVESALLINSDGITSFLPLVYKMHPPPFAYFYAFEDTGCDGWTIHYFDTNEPDPPGAWSAYCGKERLGRNTYGNNGVYSVKTSAAWNTWIYTAPVILADTHNFTIVLDGKWTQDFMWASAWGVYFNANAARTKFYSMQLHQTAVPDPPEVQANPQYSIRRWLNFRGTAIDDNDILEFRRCPHTCALEDYQWNRMTIRRVGDFVYFYLGDAGYPSAYNVEVKSLYLPEYTSAEYNGIGVLQGNFEFMNWNGDEPAYQIDNFYANPVYRVR
jgi:hypothetical protein